MSTAPGRRLAAILAVCAWAAPLAAQPFHVYVGDLSDNSVLLAWGMTTRKGNTIGRESAPHGEALVRVGERTAASRKNWVRIGGLEPDRDYGYEVSLGGRTIGKGSVRTWGRGRAPLAFFVIGDYGTGGRAQWELAEVMWRTFEERRQAGNPVRFVLTTGDNIYAALNLGIVKRHTGSDDRRWEKTFFGPYDRLLASIPFYPTLGNHDCNESESRRDLAIYLDNFFFPGDRPARHYSFTVGGLAEFFALDTSSCTEAGPARFALTPESAQFAWVKQALGASSAPWKIAYFHHPPFSAGPRHRASLDELRHVVDLFGESGVAVVFNGHEHNFQYSERNDATRGVQYVVSGAGGELRRGDPTGNMKAAQIAAWAPQRHFLLVDVDEQRTRIAPLGTGAISARGPSGQPVPAVIEIGRPAPRRTKSGF